LPDHPRRRSLCRGAQGRLHLWSNLSKSTGGKTVVNIEGIQEGNVGEFFADPVFLEKFRMLDSVSTSEFRDYTVNDLVLPIRADL